MSGYYSTSIESVLEGMIPAAVRDGMGEKTQRMIESTPLGSTEKGKQLVIRSPKQRLLLDHLIKKAAPVKLNETIKTLGVGQSVAKGLVEKGLARESKDAVMRVAYGDDLMDSGDQVYAEVELTDEQSKASSEIKESLKTNRFSTHLLLGITGSGKTEVYFEVMEEALSTGGAFCFWFPKSLSAPQTVLSTAAPPLQPLGRTSRGLAQSSFGWRKTRCVELDHSRGCQNRGRGSVRSFRSGIEPPLGGGRRGA